MRYPETAKLIKSARLRKGWSQERAAVAVGCSRLQFIRWEQGLHRPAEHARELVDTLGVDEKMLEAADDDEEAASMGILADPTADLMRALERWRDQKAPV